MARLGPGPAPICLFGPSCPSSAAWISRCQFARKQRKTLCGVADYLHRNRARMRYDEYLAKGWPIASGPVEGACKNLIKDRMERSGCDGPRTWPRLLSNSEPST